MIDCKIYFQNIPSNYFSQKFKLKYSNQPQLTPSSYYKYQKNTKTSKNTFPHPLLITSNLLILPDFFNKTKDVKIQLKPGPTQYKYL